MGMELLQLSLLLLRPSVVGTEVFCPSLQIILNGVFHFLSISLTKIVNFVYLY